MLSRMISLRGALKAQGRSLSLCHSDSNIYGIALDFALATCIREWADNDQRGFIEYRLGIGNILESHTYGRCYAMTVGSFPHSANVAHSGCLPAMMFTIFAAFPNVALS